MKLDIWKFSQKILKGTELNRCKKYGDKLDGIAEQVWKIQGQVYTTDDNKYNY